MPPHSLSLLHVWHGRLHHITVPLQKPFPDHERAQFLDEAWSRGRMFSKGRFWSGERVMPGLKASVCQSTPLT
jgi:hypothetical protein